MAPTTKSRRTRRRPGGLAAAGMALVVVTTAGTVALPAAGAAHKHTISTKAAASQYLSDDATFQQARTAFQSAFTQWFSAKEPSSDTTAFVDPFVTACRTFATELQTQSWPSADHATVKAFAKSLGTVASDVSTLPSVTLATGPAWAAKLKKDSTASIDLAKKLRKKLGLSATG